MFFFGQGARKHMETQVRCVCQAKRRGDSCVPGKQVPRHLERATEAQYGRLASPKHFAELPSTPRKYRACFAQPRSASQNYFAESLAEASQLVAPFSSLPTLERFSSLGSYHVWVWLGGGQPRCPFPRRFLHNVEMGFWRFRVGGVGENEHNRFNRQTSNSHNLRNV